MMPRCRFLVLTYSMIVVALALVAHCSGDAFYDCPWPWWPIAVVTSDLVFYDCGCLTVVYWHSQESGARVPCCSRASHGLLDAHGTQQLFRDAQPWWSWQGWESGA